MKKSIFLLLAIGCFLGLSAAVSQKECVAQALEHNLGLQGQRQLIQAAEHEKKAALADFLPRVEAFGNYTYLNDPVVYDLEEDFVEFMTGIEEFGAYLDAAHAQDPNWGAVSDLYDPSQSPLYNLITEMYEAGLLDESLHQEFGSQNNYLAGIAVTQPIFTGGKLWEKYKINQSLQKVSEVEFEQKKQELIYETRRRYWLVVELEARRQLAQKYLETIQRYEEDVQNYLEEGIVTGNELLAIQVKRHDAELKLLKVQNGVALSRMALNQIMGNDLKTQLQLTDTLPEKAVYTESPDTAGEIYSRRPELQLLDLGLDMLGSAQRIAFSGYLPNIVFTASYTTLNPNPYNSFEEEFGNSWQAGITAQWEIFSWNQRGNSYRASVCRRKALSKELLEARELVSLQYQQAVYKVQESVAKVRMCERNLEAGEANLEETQQRYREGLVSTAELLEAQTMWYNAGSEDIAARVEYVLQQSALKKAAGNLNNK